MFSVFEPKNSDNQVRTDQEKHDEAMDSIEFSVINSILDELKIQQEKLENICSQNNATLLDKQKNAYISGICNRINETVTDEKVKFANKKDHNNIEVLKARFTLVERCTLNITHILSDNFSKDNIEKSLAILNTHRDTWRNITLFPLHYFGVCVAVVMTGPGSLLGIIGWSVASHLGLRVSESILGIKANTASVKLLDRLYLELARLSTEISKKIEKIEPGASKAITKDIVKDIIQVYNIVSFGREENINSIK